MADDSHVFNEIQMAKFLTTSATNYYLEELIKNANKCLVLISPYLKFNDRIMELLVDKDRLKIDIRIVYGKRRDQIDEIKWLNQLTSIQVQFCKNLHAKCYLSENHCIITSLNLHLFSQINNNEMGILISRADDSELYTDAFEEARRIVRISKGTKLSADLRTEKIADRDNQTDEQSGKLTSSRMARKLGFTTDEFLRRLVLRGLLELRNGEHCLSVKGKQIGGEHRTSSRFGAYFLWPENAFLKPS